MINAIVKFKQIKKYIMMKRNIKLIGIGLIFLSVFVGCKTQKDEENKDVVFSGYIENTQVNVTTKMPGQIMAIYVDEGDTLKNGQVVAKLDTRAMEAQLGALKAKLKNIEVNKKRVANLYKAGAVPLQKLDEIETGYTMLQDKIRAIQIKIDDMTIKAPMDGIVTVKVLEINQMMPPGMPVVIETNPNESAWARFNIPESYLDQIQLGDKFTLSTNIKGVSLNAKVIQVIPMVNFATILPTEESGNKEIKTFEIKMKILSGLDQCKPGISVFITLKNISLENGEEQ